MAVALEIVWRNPEPPERSAPKITRSAPGEYSLDGNSFEIIYCTANRVCDDYGYIPFAFPQDNVIPIQSKKDGINQPWKIKS